MEQFKSTLKTIGFWLVFVIAVILGSSAIYTLTERNGLGSVTGWVLAGITLLLLFFLFVVRRGLFIITTITLVSLGIMILPTRIAALYISEDSKLNQILYLSVATIIYFWGAYLITNQRLLKIIGILLILAITFTNILQTVEPDYSRLIMVLNRMVWALMAGMGIFMVMRKGIGLRLLGIGLIVATMLTVFMALLSYSSPSAITGQDRTIILGSAEPRINELFEAWNGKDYQKFSKNFNDEMKGDYGQDKFMSARNELGKLISTDEMRQLAPESDSPSVAVEANFIKVMYGTTFEKYPVAKYLITVNFQKYDNKYLIGGLTIDSIKSPK